MATKPFDAEDFAAFLKLLPSEVAGVPLRHALEPRHESFRDPAFVDMARAAGAAIVAADDETHPQIADVTALFTYARLQRQREPDCQQATIRRESEPASKGWTACPCC